MSSFRWGVFGTGAISAKFVAGLAAAPDARAVMVASRSGDSAQAFARAFGVERAIEGYEEAAGAGGVDAVYVATPAALHHPHALLCLRAGLPVLIEKPFALNAGQAREIAAAAREAKVFCMEGMWTRFMPAARRLKQLLAAGAIGEARQVSGSFGTAYRPDPQHGNFDPARGGGALAHLGVYPLSLAQGLFGAPTEIAATARFGATGVDEEVAMTLRYPGDVIASFQASLRATLQNDFQVRGTEGGLAFRGPIFRPFGLDARKAPPRGALKADLGLKARLRESGAAQRLAQLAGQWGARGARGSLIAYAGNGYHYEAIEVARCLSAGALESAIMPLDDSIAVAAAMDQIRRSITPSPSGDTAP